MDALWWSLDADTLEICKCDLPTNWPIYWPAYLLAGVGARDARASENCISEQNESILPICYEVLVLVLNWLTSIQTFAPPVFNQNDLGRDQVVQKHLPTCQDERKYCSCSNLFRESINEQKSRFYGHFPYPLSPPSPGLQTLRGENSLSQINWTNIERH